MTEKTSTIIEQRKQKLETLKEKRINLFPNDFRALHSVQDIKAAIEDPGAPITEKDPIFVVTGRMMAINKFGKAS